MKDFLNQLASGAAYCHSRNSPDSDLNYASVADYVRDRGHDFLSREPLTEEQYEYLVGLASQVGAVFRHEHFWPKECFTNATLLVMADGVCRGLVGGGRPRRLTYCEGYCYSGLMPVHHAWVLLDGKLVDVTRSLRPEAPQEFIDGRAPQEDLRDRILGAVPDGWGYLGLEFSYEEVEAAVLETGEAGSLIDDWERGYPLFKQKRIGPPPDTGAWEAIEAMKEAGGLT